MVSPVQGKKQRSGKGSLAAVAIVLVVLVLAAGFLVRAGVIPFARAGSGTATWTMYHDKLGIFTARYPSAWKLDSRVYTFTDDSGVSVGSWSQTSEDAAFIDPAPNPGSPAKVDIHADLIGSNTAQRAFWCDKDGPQPITKTSQYPPKSFNGVSALTVTYSTWQIVTSNALIQISAYVASTNRLGASQSSNAADYKGPLDDILNSIQIANTKPLVC
jgi:hypothetical protein